MNQVYIILAHNNFQNLYELIKKIYIDGNTVLLHIDKKVKKNDYLILMKKLETFNKIVILPRKNCSWGSFELVDVVLNGIEYLIKNNINFQYCSLISGTDFLIKNQKYISNFLEKNSGREYIQYYPKDSGYYEDHILDRFKYKHIPFITRIPFLKSKIRFVLEDVYMSRRLRLKNKISMNNEIFCGSQWWTLTNKAIRYIYNYVKINNNYTKFFKYTFIPDESFFQTILLNSHFKNNIFNCNYRYIQWDKTKMHPVILDENNYDVLINSNCLYARKFDDITSKALREKLINNIF